ncbi:MAG: aminopeptidase [Planctomycetes bacterium]|nr:aminopeptidase [Planctomycetota bacterium]
MTDARMTRLAEVLVNYSTELKSGEKVLIEAIDVPHEMTAELIRVARAAGADPLVTLKSNAILRSLLIHGSEAQLKLIADVEAERMRNVQAYIGVRGSHNIAEMSDVSDEAMKRYQSIWWRPVHGEIRVRRTRWVVLRYPSPSMAQQARMSSAAFEDFYFEVCTMDYERMARAMKPLAARMAATDRVRIVGPGTELEFSIRGIPAVCCDGKLNIPDGEVFTAPQRDSVNGTICFNAPTIYQGVTHDGIRLVFKEGKVVEATSSDSEHLNRVLDTDEGARYVGEYALGFNPYITRPMLDILFDEKIAGSFHFTPGAAYEDDADNGNRSAIHWDMVCLQDADHGGGEVWFDDTLIRRDGLFVVEELAALNPGSLK